MVKGLILQSWWSTLLTEFWLSLFAVPEMTVTTMTTMMNMIMLMMMMMIMMMITMMRVCEAAAGDPVPTRAPSAPRPNLTQSLNYLDHHHNDVGYDDDDEEEDAHLMVKLLVEMVLSVW